MKRIRNPARFGDGGRLRPRYQALSARHAEYAQLPGLGVSEGDRGLGKCHLHLARQQIGHRWRRSLIRYVHHVDPGHAAEIFDREVRAAAGARRAKIELAGPGLGERDEFGGDFAGTDGCTTRK